jgi:hypothetical protein
MAKAIQQGGRNVWTGYLEWGGVDDFFWMSRTQIAISYGHILMPNVEQVLTVMARYTLVTAMQAEGG